MLLFRREFRRSILGGGKTRTIRFWRRRMVRPGRVHRAPGIGFLRVLAVEEISPEDLTEEDARADGFPSLGALRAELDRLYDEEARRARRCFRVTFEYLGEAPPG